MNNYCNYLNLPVPFIPHNFANNKHFEELIITPDLINEDFHIWLASLNLKTCPRASRFIIRPPYTKGSIHVDAYDNHATKLNLVYDSNDALMFWYKMLPDRFPKTQINYQKEVIRSYHIDDCEQLLTTPANNHCLVNAKMIHRIDIGSNNNQYRKCYSLTLLDSNNNRVSWEDAVVIFSNYFTPV